MDTCVTPWIQIKDMEKDKTEKELLLHLNDTTWAQIRHQVE